MRAAMDVAPLYVSIAALMIALIAFAVPVSVSWSDNWLTKTLAAVFLVLGILILTVPLILLPIARDFVRRAQAIAWLGAYEDELQRRRNERGWRGRAWRRSH